MYQPHESLANLSPEEVAAIFSNRVFLMNNEYTQDGSDSTEAILSLDTNGSSILFSSPLVAREAAYILRGEWDGLNAVILHQTDTTAINTTVQLLELELGQKIEFCRNQEFCCFRDDPQIHLYLDDRPRAGKSILLTESLIQAILTDGGSSFINCPC